MRYPCMAMTITSSFDAKSSVRPLLEDTTDQAYTESTTAKNRLTFNEEFLSRLRRDHNWTISTLFTRYFIIQSIILQQIKSHEKLRKNLIDDNVTFELIKIDKVEGTITDRNDESFEIGYNAKLKIKFNENSEKTVEIKIPPGALDSVLSTQGTDIEISGDKEAILLGTDIRKSNPEIYNDYMRDSTTKNVLKVLDAFIDENTEGQDPAVLASSRALIQELVRPGIGNTLTSAQRIHNLSQLHKAKKKVISNQTSFWNSWWPWAKNYGNFQATLETALNNAITSSPNKDLLQLWLQLGEVHDNLSSWTTNTSRRRIARVREKLGNFLSESDAEDKYENRWEVLKAVNQLITGTDTQRVTARAHMAITKIMKPTQQAFRDALQKAISDKPLQPAMFLAIFKQVEITSVDEFLVLFGLKTMRQDEVSNFLTNIKDFLKCLPGDDSHFFQYVNTFKKLFPEALVSEGQENEGLTSRLFREIVALRSNLEKRRQPASTLKVLLYHRDNGALFKDDLLEAFKEFLALSAEQALENKNISNWLIDQLQNYLEKETKEKKLAKWEEKNKASLKIYEKYNPFAKSLISDETIVYFIENGIFEAIYRSLPEDSQREFADKMQGIIKILFNNTEDPVTIYNLITEQAPELYSSLTRQDVAYQTRNAVDFEQQKPENWIDHYFICAIVNKKPAEVKDVGFCFEKDTSGKYKRPEVAMFAKKTCSGSGLQHN